MASVLLVMGALQIPDMMVMIYDQWLTDCWHFCCDSFSLLRQLCTVGHGIFYMADVNNFSLVN